MSYSCELCNYVTTDSGNFCKHKRTKKHLENEAREAKIASNKNMAPNWSSRSKNYRKTTVNNNETDFHCDMCGRTFAKLYNLNRHLEYGRCKGETTKIRSFEDQLKFFQLENQLKFQEMESQHKIREAELIAKLDAEEKANHEKKAFIMSGKVGTINNYNMSVRNFVEKNYPDAPALTCLGINNMDSLGKEEKDMDLTDVLIYHFKENRLANYLGDFLVRHYKTNNPSKQSVWTSDASRLTYIIRELVANNTTMWNADKKGVKTKDFIVVPMLEHIKPYLVEYIKTKSSEAKNITIISEQVRWYDNISAAYKIQTNIENNRLADEILKYIAPHLYMDKMDIEWITGFTKNGSGNVYDDDNNKYGNYYLEYQTEQYDDDDDMSIDDHQISKKKRLNV
jgi:hypothetical protein